MSIGNNKPYAILVFGAPMSGKTSFGEHFGDAINAPFLNLSKLTKEHHITKKLAHEIVQQVSRSKSAMIIEGFIDTEAQRTEMKKLLTDAGYQPIIVWVQTDLNTIKQRMRHAYKSIERAKAILSESYERIEAPADTERPLVISGKHTYQTQCNNIINCLPDLKN